MQMLPQLSHLNNTDANATIDTTLSNGSVQVTYPGIYNYQFSAQFDKL
jgi:hypothetical protein